MEEEKQTQVQTPQPAKKPIWKKWWFWVLSVIAFFVLIALLTGDGSPKVVDDSGRVIDRNTGSQEVFQIGDRIQLGRSTITVNEVEFSKGGGFLTPSDGNEWVNLSVAIENTGSTDQYVTTLGQMFIRDGAGNSYQVAPTDRMIENPGFGLDGTVLANSRRTGWVGFEINDGATGLQFQYNGSMFGGGTILVDLGR